MEGPGAHLHVVGLQNHATVVGPVALQGEDQALERMLGTHMRRQLSHDNVVSRSVRRQGLTAQLFGRPADIPESGRGTYKLLVRRGSSGARRPHVRKTARPPEVN